MMKKIMIFSLLLFTAIDSETLVFPPYGHSYGIRKAKPAHLFMLLGPRTFFDDPQGLATTRLESWEDTTTKKDDDEVVVYGVNSGRHEIIYNTSMWTLAVYGGKGSGIDQFCSPKGIAADPKGNVYVADSGNNRVVHLFNPGRGLRWKKSFGEKLSADKGLEGPSRISLDQSGNIYVNDPGNSRIVVFTKDGDLLKKIPGDNKYSFESGPTALVVADGTNRWSHFKKEQFIFCADLNGTRLWKIDMQGILIKKTNLPQGYQACYAAIDYYHNIWLTDTYNHCVLKYDRNLQLLDIFGSYGTGDNQFVETRGITIYQRFGQVFIAEKKGAQYYWIGTDLKSFNLSRQRPGKYYLTVNATEFSFVTLFSVSGSDTSFLLKRRMITPGGCRFPVFQMESGKITRNQLTLKIEPTYSSYTYNAWFFPVSVNE
jgi:hypothetical protein